MWVNLILIAEFYVYHFRVEGVISSLIKEGVISSLIKLAHKMILGMF